MAYISFILKWYDEKEKRKKIKSRSKYYKNISI